MASGDPTLARKAALASTIAVASIGLGLFVAVFRKLLLLVLLGLVFNELFQAIADPLHRRFGGPRVLWVSVAVVLVLGLAAGLIALCIYPFTEQLSKLAVNLPDLVHKAVARIDGIENTTVGMPATAPTSLTPLELDRLVAGRIADVTVGFGALAFAAAETIFQALAVIFLGVFVAASPLSHRLAFLHLMPGSLRPRGKAFLATARQALRDWMVAVTFSMGIMSVVVTTGLWLLGVPYFLVFGAIAGGMELVPYLGPVIGFVGPFLLCLVTEPAKAVPVIIFYFIVHGLEANVIVPLLVKSRAHLPPSLTVLAILVFGALAGVVGLIAATPALALIMAGTQELWLQPQTTSTAGEGETSAGGAENAIDTAAARRAA